MSNAIDQEFVFIIGAARSGTKFLRDLLAASDAVAVVPFDVNYVWRYGNETLVDDIIDPQSADPNKADYIAATLTSMARKNAGSVDGRIVIDKTVSNVFRVPYLYRLFPNARYIYLLRDGRDVAESAARQWQAPPEYRYALRKLRYLPLRNLPYLLWFVGKMVKARVSGHKGTSVWGPRYPGIEQDVQNRSTLEVAAIQWRESVDAAEQGLAQVPEKQKYEIRYEDLIKGDGALRGLLEFLQLVDKERVIERHKQVVNTDTGGRWRRLAESDQRAMLALLNTTLERLGYGG